MLSLNFKKAAPPHTHTQNYNLKDSFPLRHLRVIAQTTTGLLKKNEGMDTQQNLLKEFKQK